MVLLGARQEECGRIWQGRKHNGTVLLTNQVLGEGMGYVLPVTNLAVSLLIMHICVVQQDTLENYNYQS